MDGILLVIGTLTALVGLIFIFLIWGEQKHISQNTFNPIDGLRAEGMKPSGKWVPEEIHPILKKDEGDNWEGKYDH